MRRAVASLVRRLASAASLVPAGFRAGRAGQIRTSKLGFAGVLSLPSCRFPGRVAGRQLGHGALAVGCLCAPLAQVRADDVADFYRGRTISLVISTAPGGEYDLHGRLIGRFIGRHIPGVPTVVAQNMSGGGGLVMANYLYSVAPKDGTVLGVHNKALPAAQVMGEPGLKLDHSKLTWIGSLAPNSETMALWKTTGARSLEDARRTEIVIGTSGTDNITYMFPKLIAELLGARFRVITGYRGGNDINIAMERGEVGGRQNAWSAWKSTKPGWLKGGDIVIIAQGGETASDLPGVPNVEDIARTEDDKRVFRLVLAGSRLGRPIVSTPGVPAERVNALRAAFDATMKDPAFLAACREAAVDVEPVSGAKLQEIVELILATPASTAQRAKTLLK